jgi:8-hydroxy-5-deazaflavin:NADPH oxidoreductase
MRIGIIGAGNVGAGLARLWSGAGHEVMLSGSRDQSKLKKVAGDAGAKTGSVPAAVEFGDVILLAVPWRAVGDILDEAGPPNGKTIIDATNNVGDETSSFQMIERRAPDASVVKAFNTIFAALYDEMEESEARPDMVFCGDDAEAKKSVAQLISDAGFNPIDAGGSEQAPAIEYLARLVINLAYAQGIGPFVYRFAKPSEL